MVFNPSAGADEALWAVFFFQNNQYSVHGCFTPSFIKINLLVSEKKIFEGFFLFLIFAPFPDLCLLVPFFTIYGHGGHLGHVT